MRQAFAIATTLACLTMSIVSIGQDESKPALSSAPLTAEQLAIYRVVLKNYRKDDKSPMNLADRTDPLERQEGSSGQGCINSIKGIAPTVIHRISNASALGPGVVLVDPERLREQIDKNDPQHLIMRAIDDHQKVTEKELNDSVKLAFETGLFTLSEIAFDREHRYAVVSYSFVCGGLCGNGKTLVVRRTGQTWKVTKHCGGWVS